MMTKLRIDVVLLKLFLLLNSQCVIVLACPPENIPEVFEDLGDDPILRGPVQAIIPDYTFSCYGSVTMWGACVHPVGNVARDLYDIAFQVFRPTPGGAEGCYDLVGFNFIPLATAIGDGNMRRCILLEDIPPEDQVQVEPGDVVGFYAAHYRDGTELSNGGIQLDDSRSDVTVWYRLGEQIATLGGNGTTLFHVTPENDLEMQDNHPPVITAQVYMSTVSPIPHSNSSPFTSPLPSPTTAQVYMSTSTVNVTMASSPTKTSLSISHTTPSLCIVRQSGSTIIPSSSSTNLISPSPIVTRSIVLSSLSTNQLPPSPTASWPGSDGDGESPAVFAGVAAAVASILAVGVLVIIAAIVLVRKRRKHKPQPSKVSVNQSYGVVLPNLSNYLETNAAYGAWGGVTGVSGSVTEGDNSNQAAEYAVVQETEHNEYDSATLTNEGYEYSYPRETTGWPTPQDGTQPEN